MRRNDELREYRFPWNRFRSMQYFDVLKIKFELWRADIDGCERTQRRLIILMRKNWLIRLSCFRQSFLTSSEVDYEIKMIRSWWLRKNWKKVDNIDAKELTDSTLQFPAKDFWQVQKLMIARELKASWQYRCKRFDWIDFSVFDRNSEVFIRKPQLYFFLQW